MEAGIGELNPCPMQVGGGPTPTSKAYALLRNAVGEGGSARDDRGIEGLWRRSRAHGLAAATSAVERVVLQLDPDLATDFLPYYERVLGIVPPAGAAPATRAAEAGVGWTAQIDALVSTIAASLARIDARLTLLTVLHERGATVQEGRALDSQDVALEGPGYGGVRHSLFPSYATEFVLHVLFTLGHPPPLTGAELRVIERAKAYLLDVLPSWIDFQIATGEWQVGITPIGFGSVG